MRISGIQKNSLIDWPPNIVSTLFAGGCNFRCPWCHNPDLVKNLPGGSIKRKEIKDHIRQRKEWLDGICLSGGEPLFQEDAVEFLKEINRMGIKIKLDTNGYFPLKLKDIIEQKLVEYIAMDIKAPLEESFYSKACGVNVKINRIKQSISAIMDSGIDYEFRTTVVPGLIACEQVKAIAEFISGAKKYILQNYRGGKTLDEKYSSIEPYTSQGMEELKKAAAGYVKVVEIK